MKQLDQARFVAVGSRPLDKAQAFAADHTIERAYGSYLDMVQDPDVDAVYVALAQLFCAIRTSTSHGARIDGTEGAIEIPAF